MKPQNNGDRIYIEVCGWRRSGYWNGSTVGWYCTQRWFQKPAATLDEARDELRYYFTVYTHLLRGEIPEGDAAARM